MMGRLSKGVRVGARVGVSLVLLGALVVTFGPSRFRAALARMTLTQVLEATALGALRLAVGAARWHLLSSRGSSRTKRLTFGSFLVAVRAMDAPSDWRSRITKAERGTGGHHDLEGLALLDALLDVAVVALAAAYGVWGPIVFAWGAAAGALGSSLWPHLRRLQWTTRGTLRLLSRGLDTAGGPTLVASGALAAVSYGLRVPQFHLLLVALGFRDWGASARLVPWVAGASFLPVGACGVPEWMAALMLSSRGRSVEGALAAHGVFLLQRLLPRGLAYVAGRGRAHRTSEAA